MAERKPEDLKLDHEDDPRRSAERYLNRQVALVRSLEQQLRQAKVDERRARAELGQLESLEIQAREGAPHGRRP